jgi:hypothetical protein
MNTVATESRHVLRTAEQDGSHDLTGSGPPTQPSGRLAKSVSASSLSMHTAQKRLAAALDTVCASVPARSRRGGK